MDFALTPGELDFKEEVRTWLEEHMVGEFANLRGKGGTGQEDIPVEVQIAWEKELATGGWLGIDYPVEVGGRGCTLMEQVTFHATYVESRAPGRIPNVGITLAGPTIVHYGSPKQIQRFLPPMLSGQEYWCQGYSEPDAGSDLANVKTRAQLMDGEWVLNGQKIWTSLAQHSDWCFVVARTDPDSRRHAGLSYLLVPMDQEGVDIRPIVQLTGGTEFNETFFTDARTAASNVVGDVGDGWRVAMGTLGFERGASTLGQQLSFRQELEELVELAQRNGTANDPAIRQELARAWETLEVLRFNNLRMLSVVDQGAVPGPEMSIGKLYWASWHRWFGELVTRVRGMDAIAGAAVAGERYPLDRQQRTFLYSRAHTIYGGSNQVQRNVIGERVLGLPREPRP